MKKISTKIKTLGSEKMLVPLFLLTSMAMGGISQAQTWVTGTTGNWSAPANWTGGAPANDGSATVTITGTNAAFTSTIDSAWAGSNGALYGLALNPGTVDFTLGVAAGASPVGLGAGGITMAGVSGRTVKLDSSDASTLNLTASQAWNVGAGSTLATNNKLKITSAAGVVLTKSGAGTLSFSGGASSVQGGIILNQGNISVGSSAIGTLGSTPLTWQNNGVTGLQLGLYSNGMATQTFAQAITFASVGTNSTDYYQLATGLVAAGKSLNITGNWSGTAGKQLQLNAAGAGQANGFEYGIAKISGNNSGLTATGGVWIRNGNWVLDSSNAFGVNNAFSVSIGQNSVPLGSMATLASLRATSGNNVGSTISTLINVTSSAVQELELGLSGVGSVNFSGNTTLATATLTTNAVPLVYLTAATGGTARFTGNIADSSPTNAYVSPVFIKGGGTVELAGLNSYRGKTTVGGGSTLLLSGTLGSALTLGYNAAPQVAATTTSGATTITGITSTAGFVVGQTVTGTGIAAGSVITSIDSSTAIHISKTATATGSITDLAGVAEMGILSGTGTIAGATTVNSGATIAPGNSSIGKLTLQNGLTLQGAYAAKLGASGASPSLGNSDQVAVTGNLSLTGGVLSLANDANASGKGSAGAGAYRLITYTGALTGTFASVTNPLSATLHEKVGYNSGSVDLNLYRLATANTLGNVSFGKFHAGSTQSTVLSASNTAASDGFSEALDVSGSATGEASVSGGGTAAAGSSTGLTVGLANTAGVHSGSVVVSLASDGTGTSGYGATALTGQTINVSGTGYNLAAANTFNTPVNLGITHVSGTFGSTSLSIKNTAAASGGYTEGLNAGGTATGAASVIGTIGNLGAQVTSTDISVGLGGSAHTGTAGLVSGTVGIALASSGINSGLGDTGLTTQDVTVNGQVNYYAAGAFAKSSGDGDFAGSGTSYTLTLGTYNLNDAAKTFSTVLTLTNTEFDAIYQDFLAGTLSLTGDGFTLTGLSAVNLASGNSTQLTLSFDTTGIAASGVGTYTGVLTFSGTSVNTSNSTGLDSVSVAVGLQVVPEPATWSMIVGGLGLMAFGQRARRRMS